MLNSALIPVLLGGALSMAVSDAPVNQTWYESEGVVQQAFTLIVVTAAVDFIKAVPPDVLLKRHVLSHFVYSEKRLAALYRGAPMHLSQVLAPSVCEAPDV